MTGAVDGAARDGARRSDRRDCVWMNSTPHQPVRDRINDAQIPVFEPVRQNLHSVPSRRKASGPEGDPTNGVAVEPPPGGDSARWDATQGPAINMREPKQDAHL